MAAQEIQDVRLCQASVYAREDVVPLDQQQLPDIERGLMLWNLGTAFHILALGCVMYGWASVSIRQLLGKTTLVSTTAALLMLATGIVGFAGGISSHFGVFSNIGDMSRARSVSRLVTSTVFLVFLGMLVWVALRLARIIRQTRVRDPYATAAIVSASHKQYAQHPMAVLRYLLGMQTLAWMQDSVVLLAVLLFVRVVFFLAFDISFLTPQQSAIRSMGSANTLNGMATLASSLLSVAMVRLLLPRKPDMMADVFTKVGELDPSARTVFFDGKAPDVRGLPVPQMSSAGNTRNHSLSSAGDANGRSRAPTTASLAVEKLMGSSTPVLVARPSTTATVTATTTPTQQQQHPYSPVLIDTCDKSMPVMSNGSLSPMLQQPMYPFSSGAKSADGPNFLQHIPYIDRNARENSYFSQGPWVHPVTHTFSPSASIAGSEVQGSTMMGSLANAGVVGLSAAGPFVSTPSVHLEQLVRSNTGAELVTIEGRQDMLRQSEAKNGSMLFSDPGSDMHYLGPANGTAQQSRTQVTASAYIPISSSNFALTSNNQANGGSNLSDSVASNNTHPSGPSLRFEALQYYSTDNDKADSIISSYMRPDNESPQFKNVLVGHRTSSVISDEYQYEPMNTVSVGGNDGMRAVSSNPFDEHTASVATTNRLIPTVYVAEPIPENTTAEDEDVDGDESKGSLGNGPILIHRGSKASLRRKNTVERRKGGVQKNETGFTESSNSSSVNSSQDMLANETASQSMLAAPAEIKSVSFSAQPAETVKKPDADKKARVFKSRMSAFDDPPAGQTSGASGATSPVSERPSKRDSATISAVPWDGTNGKPTSEVPLNAVDEFGHKKPLAINTMLHRQAPSAASIHSMRLSPESGSASLPNSLFRQSFSSLGRRSNDIFSSFSSINTSATGDVFYTPGASIANMANGSINGESNWLDALDSDILIDTPNASQTDFASPSVNYMDERPFTAPSRTAVINSHRHTLAAHEQTIGSTRSKLIIGDSNASQISVDIANEVAGVRRTQTLRKARASDAHEIESSIQGPTEEDTTGALISALPMPTPTLSNDRMIL
ncbi:hypothetical protein BX661DRAFT_172296 [Kickxella alabastrina]|uniref:uncharacterized protein n=1 Tax=Kickxella alabastrina TaxID=61397 RepID=UPI00221E836C|nr:uncharacterized protein BX661DRAFT_172296 [Kickxella alabastrina]KAI7824465.1 hypothetical protein BX661DRAFT_172296 [Kickxella alabastrina]